ncbi:MAG: glucose-6-phosphate dehydrogenase, partial [Spirochaetia bacterium]|nr:glucose-6-phosphate dehydrogenase [Spirochaetia bacterium]
MKQIVIQFGGTGDLAKKKLYPAYERLMSEGFDFTIVALGRRYTSKDEFVKDSISEGANKRFIQKLDYLYYDMEDEKGATDALYT